MKIIYIECDAEEMRANRTILDNLSEVFSSITRSVVGFDVSSENVANAMAMMNEEENEEVDV